MRYLIIGRKYRKWVSGLGEVGLGIRDMLKVRNVVVMIDDNEVVEFKVEEFNNFDAIVLLGDSSVEEVRIAYLRKHTILPILSLCLLRNSYEDAKEIKRIKNLNETYKDIYFFLWDYTFMYERFSVISKFLISIPKPIRKEKIIVNPFSKRKGICLGQIAKTLNSRFSGHGEHDNLNVVGDILIKLKNKYRDIDFYMYGGRVDIDNCMSNIKTDELRKCITPILINNTGKENLVKFLNSIRIFANLQSSETFYLVPIEAQGVGTPVLYRHMPQSLTPYIGFSGFLIEDFEDMCSYIDNIYYNEENWRIMSKSSLQNFENLTCQNRELA